MSGNTASPEKAIGFIKFAVVLACCWPPAASASACQLIRFRVAKIAALLNASALFLPLVYALHVKRADAQDTAKAAYLATASLQVIFQILFSIGQHERFQRLIEEINACCEKAELHERRVFERYVNRYSGFYATSALWSYMAASITIFGTLFISEPFPTNAQYPFPVDSEPVRSIVFVQQALVGMQCASHVCVNMFAALLLLFAAARFEILTIELRAVNDAATLAECIRKYYASKRFAMEAVLAIRYIVLSTIAACGIASVFCGINIIGRQPFTVKLQSLVLAGTALLEVFMCAWPADHLMTTSKNVMHGVYDSAWYERPVGLQKSMLLVLTPETTVTLSVKCVVPVLSLNYFCSFISNAFSLFTALRIVMLKGENDDDDDDDEYSRLAEHAN